MSEEKARELVAVLNRLMNSEWQRASERGASAQAINRAEGAASAYEVAARLVFEAIGE